LKYQLKIGSETLTLDSSNPGCEQDMQLSINGKEYHVCCNPLSDTHFHLLVNGKATEAFVFSGQNDEKHVCIKGLNFLVLNDKVPLSRVKRKGFEEAPGEITPPMPSVVIRIMVAEGDMVKKGQGLVVLSAMKMETTLVAPTDGKVKRINTFLNAKVAPGDILVEIEGEEVDKK